MASQQDTKGVALKGGRTPDANVKTCQKPTPISKLAASALTSSPPLTSLMRPSTTTDRCDTVLPEAVDTKLSERGAHLREVGRSPVMSILAQLDCGALFETVLTHVAMVFDVDVERLWLMARDPLPHSLAYGPEGDKAFSRGYTSPRDSPMHLSHPPSHDNAKSHILPLAIGLHSARMWDQQKPQTFANIGLATRRCASAGPMLSYKPPTESSYKPQHHFAQPLESMTCGSPPPNLTVTGTPHSITLRSSLESKSRRLAAAFANGEALRSPPYTDDTHFALHFAVLPRNGSQMLPWIERTTCDARPGGTATASPPSDGLRNGGEGDADSSSVGKAKCSPPVPVSYEAQSRSDITAPVAELHYPMAVRVFNAQKCSVGCLVLDADYNPITRTILSSSVIQKAKRLLTAPMVAAGARPSDAYRLCVTNPLTGRVEPWRPAPWTANFERRLDGSQANIFATGIVVRMEVCNDPWLSMISECENSPVPDNPSHRKETSAKLDLPNGGMDTRPQGTSPEMGGAQSGVEKGAQSGAKETRRTLPDSRKDRATPTPLTTGTGSGTGTASGGGGTPLADSPSCRSDSRDDRTNTSLDTGSTSRDATTSQWDFSDVSDFDTVPAALPDDIVIVTIYPRHKTAAMKHLNSSSPIDGLSYESDDAKSIESYMPFRGYGGDVASLPCGVDQPFQLSCKASTTITALKERIATTVKLGPDEKPPLLWEFHVDGCNTVGSLPSKYLVKQEACSPIKHPVHLIREASLPQPSSSTSPTSAGVKVGSYPGYWAATIAVDHPEYSSSPGQRPLTPSSSPTSAAAGYGRGGSSLTIAN